MTVDNAETRKAMRDARQLLDGVTRPIAVALFVMGSDGKCGVIYGFDRKDAADVMRRALGSTALEVSKKAGLS